MKKVMRNLVIVALMMFVVGCKSASVNPLASSINPKIAADKEALTEFKKAGIEIIELSGVHGVIHDDTAMADIKTNLEAVGVAVNSIHYPYGPSFDISNLDEDTRLGAIREIEYYLGRLKDLGGKYLVVHPSFEPVKDNERAARLEMCRKSVLELDELMKKYPGMIIAMEDLPRTCLGNTANELNMLIEGTSPARIGICLDTNHMLQESLVDFTAKTVKRIVTVHIADFDEVDERHWYPGQGVNDWAKWYEIMRQGGYKGPMLYELTWPIARGAKLTPRQVAALIKLNYRDYFVD